MLAIAADVHGDLNRLQAFTAEVSDIAPSDVYILGDVLQFGRSLEDNMCVHIVREAGFNVVTGNHEVWAIMRGMMRSLDAPTTQAEKRKTWDIDKEIELLNIDYMMALPSEITRDDLLFAHSIPEGYGSTDDIRTPENMKQAFNYLQERPHISSCFVGHCHTPICRYRHRETGEYGAEAEPVVRLATDRIYIITPGGLGMSDEGRFLLFDPDERIVHRMTLP